MGRSLSSCLQVLLYGHTYIAMILFCLFTGIFCTDPFFLSFVGPLGQVDIILVLIARIA